MKYRLLILLFIIVVKIASQDILQLSNRFNQISGQYDAVGASYCLVYNQQIYNFNYGWKDYDRELRIDSDTKFRIASISKVITAIAAMKLVEEGLLELDSDISNYLGYDLRNPNYPNNIITLRHLLTHTSGLRDSNAYSNFLTASYAQSPPAISELLLVSGDYYNSSIWTTYYAPGNQAGWDYSNLSAGIVATIVEIMAEEHFSTFCEENIFAPLEIEACWNNFSALSDIDDLAVLYRFVGGIPSPQADNYQGLYPSEVDLEEIPLGWNGLIYAPQGGLRISTSDLAKIFLMLKNRGSYDEVEILSQTTISDMEELNWSGSGLGGFFTEMGLQLQRSYDLFDNELFYGHAGEAYGLISDAYYNIGRDIVIIFLTNGANFSYGDVFYDYEEAIFSATKEWLDALSNENNAIALEKISIYPNVINSLNEKITIKADNTIKSISLYNLKGQLVNKQISSAKDFSFSNTNLSSGFYILKIKTAGESVHKKLIIQK